jgi:hypothetical protein
VLRLHGILDAASSSAAYRPHRPGRSAGNGADALAPWREINDEVARIGGHMGMFGGAHAGHGVKPAPTTAPGGSK